MIEPTKLSQKLRLYGVPTKEAEIEYGLSIGLIRQWIHRGIRLNPGEYGKINGVWCVLPSAVERIIKEYGKGNSIT